MDQITPRQIHDIQKWVKTQVGSKRYLHIQGVVRTASKLAARYGQSVLDAQAAGWLHDCAKELSRTEMLKLIRIGPFKLDADEKRMPALWHPHAGASVAHEKWKINRKEVLEAIRCHTLGSPTMSLLAQVVFIADFIEPGRTFVGVEKARRAAQKDLRSAVLLKCHMTIEHLLRNNMKIHTRLLQTWNAFLEYPEPK